MAGGGHGSLGRGGRRVIKPCRGLCGQEDKDMLVVDEATETRGAVLRVFLSIDMGCACARGQGSPCTWLLHGVATRP